MEKSARYGSKVMLNILKNGDISYYAVYKNGKNTVYKKIGKKSEKVTEKKVMDIRSQILSELRHGIDISQKSEKSLTFGELANVYFTSNEAHNKSNEKYRLMYKKHLKDMIGDITISNLNDKNIIEIQSAKKNDDLSSSTINIIVKLIKRIIGFGIKRGIVSYNPFRNIKLFKLNNDRLRYLSHSEIETVYDWLHKQNDMELILFVRLALGTGARANSVLNVSFKDLNLEQKTTYLKDFKRNNIYVGYLDQDVLSLIEKISSKNQNKKLIGLTYQQVYNKLKPLFNILNTDLEKSDRQNRVVIHTFRHTFASHLAIKGVSIQIIQKLMNHKDINQTAKYAKLSSDSGREHLDGLYT